MWRERVSTFLPLSLQLISKEEKWYNQNKKGSSDIINEYLHGFLLDSEGGLKGSLSLVRNIKVHFFSAQLYLHKVYATRPNPNICRAYVPYIQIF